MLQIPRDIVVNLGIIVTRLFVFFTWKHIYFAIQFYIGF
jgi:hypothetical protein